MGIIENKKIIVHRSRKTEKRIKEAKNIIKIIIALLSLVLILFGVYLFCFFGKEKVDIGELMALSLSGYDGKGYAQILVQRPEGLEKFADTIEITQDKSEGLSNGDRIGLTYSYDRELARTMKLRVRKGPESIILKDLPAPRIISGDELFEAVRVSFEGISPVAGAQLTVNTRDIGEDIVTFDWKSDDGSRNLKLGDSVTVKATVDVEKATHAAMIICDGSNEITREYKVEGIPSYVERAEEIDDTMIEYLKTAAAELFAQNRGDAREFGLRAFSNAGLTYNLENTKYTFTWGRTGYISAYFSHIKEQAITEDTTHINDVKLVFNTSIHQSDGKAVNVEAVAIFRNIIRDENGKISLEDIEGEIVSASPRDSEIKKIVNGELDTDYESFKYT